MENTIERICQRVDDTAPALSYEIVRQIRAEIPGYAVVPLGEHRQFVLEEARGMLIGLAGRRPPREDQLERARELGRRRARQGLPMEMLLGAFHITYRETWNAILRQATAEDPEHGGDVAQLVNLMWTWVRVGASAAADAYSTELGTDRVTRAAITHRFLAALAASPPQTDVAATLATALGYQPQADFQALAMPAEDWAGHQAERLQRHLAALPGRQRCAITGNAMVILAQHHDTTAVLAAIRQVQGQAAAVGIGLRRPGLDGAAASITDAADALALASRQHQAVSFGESWLIASLRPRATRLEPLFSKARDTARTDPHLAAAVAAFSRHGLSVAAAARALHLHPNSLAYRLSRWHQLTGWDPRTGDGLVASLVALGLYPEQVPR